MPENNFPTNLAAATEMLTKERALLETVRQEAGQENDFSRVTSLGMGIDTDTKIDRVRQLNLYINDLAQHVRTLQETKFMLDTNADRLRDLTDPMGGIPHPGSQKDRAGIDRPYTAKDLREFLNTDPAYRAFKSQPHTVGLELPVGFKTLVTLDNISPQAQRDAAVDMALENRTITDLFGSETTQRNTIEYFELTTFNNAADFTDEGDTPNEDEMDWTLREETVRKVAVFVPMTTESAQDNNELEGMLRGLLSYSILHKEDTAVLRGDGTGINLKGVQNRVGVQSQAKGGDSAADAIYKAMQKVRGADNDGFAEPTAIIMHPNDWTPIRLERTIQGGYLWGDPSMPGVERIFGIPVRQTTGQVQGVALTGGFSMWATIVRRETIGVTLSTEDGNNFRDGKITVRGESRLALKVTRPAAFCKVTGL